MRCREIPHRKESLLLHCGAVDRERRKEGWQVGDEEEAPRGGGGPYSVG